MALSLLAASACGGSAPEDGTVAPGTSPAEITSADAAGTAGIETPPVRTYLLEQIGRTAVVRLYADGWDDLGPQERQVAYHLSRAAEAGRDIYWDQVHPANLAVRRLMEGLYRHRSQADPAVRDEIVLYTKRLWINNGFYDDRSRRKFTPGFSFADLQAAVNAVVEAAIPPSELGLPQDGDTGAALADLRRVMFDDNFQPMLTDKTAGDPVRESAVNFYQNVGTDELDRWASAGGEVHPLNSRVVKEGGTLREEVWRAGTLDGSIPPGGYAAAIERIIAHLENAAAVARPEQAAALERLITFYRTGDPEAWRAYNVAWLADRDGRVDGYNGFIEVYKDPRGRKGAYEGIVHVLDSDATRVMTDLSGNAAYFEARAPWEDMFKKQDFAPPVARAVSMLTATGDGGPGCALGVNLPNEPGLQEEHGSKSVVFANVLRAYDHALQGLGIEEFTLPDERQAARQHGEQARFLMTALHEVLGHASGAVKPGLPADPAALIGGNYNALEEARAELVALHHIWDQKLQDLRVVEARDVAEAAYQAYARSALLMLRRIRSGTTIQDDHMRATQLIVEYLIDSGSIQRLRRDGKTFHRVRSFDQMRAGVAALLAQVQRIKSTGDGEAAERLLARYGKSLDPALRDEVVARADAAGLPENQAAVVPRLEPVTDTAGNLVDVRVHHDEDLAAQMLRLARAGEGR